jgi:hypothetical protein
MANRAGTPPARSSIECLESEVYALKSLEATDEEEVGQSRV